METQLPNTYAESLQQLLNLSLGVNDNNTENVINASQPGNSIGTDQPLGIEFVEKILKYKFKDKNLLLQAFTDASFDENCVSYERLEFLGDTVLNMVVTKYLYFRYEDCTPGTLTKLRVSNIDSEKLARVAVKHNLLRCLRHKKPLLEDQVITPLLEPIIPLDKLGNHPVTELNEKCQKKNLKLKFDDNSWEIDKTVVVFIEDHFVGIGLHLSKKDIAKNCAAQNALDKFSHSFPNI